MANNDLLAAQVRSALKQVIDPELGINIVDLGLIYEVEIEQQHHAVITMTLTTMGCPLSDMLHDGIKETVESVPGVESCEIQLVWYPLWDLSQMSPEARKTLRIPEGMEWLNGKNN
ncbi:metal-sulfur cluster assembly factor [Companilactobacillus sp. FL22-1]|uniref:metal-sulfur cluster assembly factor n=1 Tax=Companilactobacillus sp. FL22-1 TaxID=3373892 RepID=UPI003754767A